MIASLTGVVRMVGETSAVIDVSGVGLQVHCAPGTIARLRLGETATVSTSLVVREDSLTLYGFADDDERSLFEVLQTASGVGPKVAQAVLATLPPREIRRAIMLSDVVALTAVPGIGKKGAERMVLDLRDKISAAADGTVAVQAPEVAPVAPWREQLHGALTGLGWSSKEADAAVEAIEPQAAEALERDGRVEVAPLLRSALRSLSR